MPKKKKEEKRKEEKKEEERLPFRSGFSEEERWERKAREAAEVISSLSDPMSNLILKHYPFFKAIHKGKISFSLEKMDMPAGWIPVLDKALDAVAKLGGSFDIAGFEIINCRPVILATEGLGPFRLVANSLLTACIYTCPCCGKDVRNTPDYYQPPMYPCSDCFRAAGLDAPDEEVCGDLPDDFWVISDDKMPRVREGFGFLS